MANSSFKLNIKDFTAIWSISQDVTSLCISVSDLSDVDLSYILRKMNHSNTFPVSPACRSLATRPREQDSHVGKSFHSCRRLLSPAALQKSPSTFFFSFFCPGREQRPPPVHVPLEPVQHVSSTPPNLNRWRRRTVGQAASSLTVIRFLLLQCDPEWFR